jgi:hypothetical protein
MAQLPGALKEVQLTDARLVQSVFTRPTRSAKPTPLCFSMWAWTSVWCRTCSATATSPPPKSTTSGGARQPKVPPTTCLLEVRARIHTPHYSAGGSLESGREQRADRPQKRDAAQCVCRISASVSLGDDRPFTAAQPLDHRTGRTCRCQSCCH